VRVEITGEEKRIGARGIEAERQRDRKAKTQEARGKRQDTRCKRQETRDRETERQRGREA
jgi:hypothetical protein